MTSRSWIAWLIVAVSLVPAAAAAQTRADIVLGATKVQRDEAARSLLPLLGDVRRRAEAPVNVGPGRCPTRRLPARRRRSSPSPSPSGRCP